MSQISSEIQNKIGLQPLRNCICLAPLTFSLIKNTAKLASKNERPKFKPDAMRKLFIFLFAESLIDSVMFFGNGRFITVIELSDELV